MLAQKAAERCAKDYDLLKNYIATRGFGDSVGDLNRIPQTSESGDESNEYVSSFSFTINPSNHLWIQESVLVEVKVTRMYPADPPEVYFKNEFSAQSILQRSNKSSVKITDGETGKISSKLLIQDGWNRSYNFSCVYHSVKRFFEITQSELLDGAVYQMYESMSPTKQKKTADFANIAWKVSMASHELQGKRRTMEDQICLIDNILRFESQSYNASATDLFSPLRLAAVFDGHGGDGASKYFANELPKTICTEVCHGNSRAPRAILSSFSKCDNRFLSSTRTSPPTGLFGEVSPDASGTTCSCVLIDRIGRCIISNVGDSRTILCRASGIALELTYDHKASSPGK